MRLPFTLAAAIFAVAPVQGVSAAEPCAAGLSQNNPAFGKPRPCGPAKPAKAATDRPVKPGAPAKVTTENGKTLYTYGNTTIAVSGSITGQVSVGKTGR